MKIYIIPHIKYQLNPKIVPLNLSFNSRNVKNNSNSWLTFKDIILNNININSNLYTRRVRKSKIREVWSKRVNRETKSNF